MEDKTPIEAISPTIYTERKNGVMPEYDIRTDRWQVALEAMDKANMSWIAQRDEKIKQVEDPKPAEPKAGESE